MKRVRWMFSLLTLLLCAGILSGCQSGIGRPAAGYGGGEISLRHPGSVEFFRRPDGERAGSRAADRRWEMAITTAALLHGNSADIHDRVIRD